MCTPQLVRSAVAPITGGIPETAAAAVLPAVLPQAPVAPGGAMGGVSAPPQAKATPQESRAPAAMASRAGAAMRDSTMLTGPGGVAPNLLSIGRSSLLGQ